MKKSIRLFWIIFIAGFSFVVIFFLMVLFGVFGKLPSTAKLENPSILQASEVYGADGTLMGKYFTERGNRSNVNYRDISKNVIDALDLKEWQSETLGDIELKGKNETIELFALKI